MPRLRCPGRHLIVMRNNKSDDINNSIYTATSRYRSIEVNITVSPLGLCCCIPWAQTTILLVVKIWAIRSLNLDGQVQVAMHSSLFSWRLVAWIYQSICRTICRQKRVGLASHLSVRHPLDHEGSAGLQWGDPRCNVQAQPPPSWASRGPPLSCKVQGRETRRASKVYRWFLTCTYRVQSGVCRRVPKAHVCTGQSTCWKTEFTWISRPTNIQGWIYPNTFWCFSQDKQIFSPHTCMWYFQVTR